MRTLTSKQVLLEPSKKPGPVPKPSLDITDTSISSWSAISMAVQRNLLCPCGGGCPRCVPAIQPKLKVGAPDDIYEQEADRAAEQVMRMPQPVVQKQPEEEEEEEELLQTKPVEISPQVQRQTEDEEEEEEEEETVQTKQAGLQTPLVRPGLESRINSLKGKGQHLPASTRSFFEPRFGHDFSQVRIHNDSEASEMAQALNARAFTVGHEITFGAGQYSPGTTEGRNLLAHELTHVVQQDSARSITGITSVHKHKAIIPGVITTEQILSRAIADELDYEMIVNQVHAAIISNNAADLFFALERLERNSGAISRFRTAYSEVNPIGIDDAINRSGLSVSQQHYARQLLFTGSGRAAQRIVPPPSSSAEWMNLTRRLRSALESGDDGTVFAVLRSLRRGRQRVLRLRSTYSGLYHENLLDRLSRDFSGRSLGYAQYLLHLEPSPTAEAAMRRFESLPAMQWVPSAGRTGTDFSEWVWFGEGTPAPPLSPSTTLNCWEAILLAAYYAGVASWQWLHDLYDRSSGRRGDIVFANMMTRGPRIRYAPEATPPRVPVRGDIVFFWSSGNHLSHVGLATGRQSSSRDPRLSPEVIEFQGRPDGPPTRIRLEPPQYRLSDGPMRIEFATPHW